MKAAGEAFREQSIHHPVPLDPALPFEGARHDMDAEMSLAAGSMSGVPFVQMRFVDDADALRMECVGQLFLNGVSGGHDMRNIVRY